MSALHVGGDTVESTNNQTDSITFQMQCNISFFYVDIP